MCPYTHSFIYPLDKFPFFPYNKRVTGHKAIFRYFFQLKDMSAITKVKNYFVEAYAELRKVTWPTQKQTKNYSLVVIGISLGLAAFFGVLDYIFNIIVGWIV